MDYTITLSKERREINKHNNNNSDHPLTSRRNDGGKNDARSNLKMALEPNNWTQFATLGS